MNSMERMKVPIGPTSQNSMIAGTVGGTLLSVFATVQPEDIVKTTVLAAIGAATSFLVSLAMKWIFKCPGRKQQGSP